jgi:hypothetical protein
VHFADQLPELDLSAVQLILAALLLDELASADRSQRCQREQTSASMLYSIMLAGMGQAYPARICQSGLGSHIFLI